LYFTSDELLAYRVHLRSSCTRRARNFFDDNDDDGFMVLNRSICEDRAFGLVCALEHSTPMTYGCAIADFMCYGVAVYSASGKTAKRINNERSASRSRTDCKQNAVEINAVCCLVTSAYAGSPIGLSKIGMRENAGARSFEGKNAAKGGQCQLQTNRSNRGDRSSVDNCHCLCRLVVSCHQCRGPVYVSVCVHGDCCIIFFFFFFISFCLALSTTAL